jgi:hypothetical protein
MMDEAAGRQLQMETCSVALWQWDSPWLGEELWLDLGAN